MGIFFIIIWGVVVYAKSSCGDRVEVVLRRSCEQLRWFAPRLATEQYGHGGGGRGGGGHLWTGGASQAGRFGRRQHGQEVLVGFAKLCPSRGVHDNVRPSSTSSYAGRRRRRLRNRGPRLPSKARSSGQTGNVSTVAPN